MRFTKKVSVWPVGFTGGVRAEGPKCNNGHVVGYHSGWASWRKFPLDMAGSEIPDPTYAYTTIRCDEVRFSFLFLGTSICSKSGCYF